MIKQVGLWVRRVSHMKRTVSPRVRMKLRQHLQQPPDSDMVSSGEKSCSNWVKHRRDETKGEEKQAALLCSVLMGGSSWLFSLGPNVPIEVI